MKLFLPLLISSNINVIHFCLSFFTDSFSKNSCTEDDKGKSKIEGCIEALSSSSMLTRISKDWKLLEQFISCMLKSYVHDNVLLQGKLYQLFGGYCLIYHHLPLISPVLSPVDLTKLPGVSPDTIQKGLSASQAKDKSNIEFYSQFYDRLLEMAENQTNLHWRYSLMIYSNLLFLFRPESIATIPSKLHRLLKLVLSGTINEVAPIRMIRFQTFLCFQSSFGSYLTTALSFSHKMLGILLTLLRPAKQGRTNVVECKTRLTSEDIQQFPQFVDKSKFHKNSQTFRC